MKKPHCLPTIFLLAVFGAGTLVGAAKSADNATEEELLKFERQWVDAYIKKDLAALERIEADDYIVIDPTGRAATKAEDIGEIKSGAMKWEAFTFDETRVRMYGKTAIVTGLGTLKASYQGTDISGKYRFTDVLIKKRGGWKAVSSQITAVAPAK